MAEKKSPNLDWDIISAEYGDYFEIHTLPSCISLFNIMNLREAKRIIELGCSTGEFSFFCLSMLRNTERYISLDFSEKMIAKANHRKEKEFPFNLNSKISHEFSVGNAEDLSSIQDESFDAYVSSMCIHLTDHTKTFKEINRVLVPGGKFGLIIPGKPLELNEMMKIIFNRVREAGGMAPGSYPLALDCLESLVKAVEDNGLAVDFNWSENLILRMDGDIETDRILNSFMFRNSYNSIQDETKKKTARDLIVQDLKERYWNTKKPLNFVSCLVVGHKKL